MKSAVIKTGGKQYLVKEGDSIKIETLAGATEKGAQVSFDEVLMTIDGDAAKVGTPTVSGAKVQAEVVRLGRHKKIIVTKYKQKSRYMKRNGHRQEFVEVKINKI